MKHGQAGRTQGPGRRPTQTFASCGPAQERASERDRDTRRKRDKRATAKEVQVPPCEDPQRRARLEADDTEWLRYYFHELFWDPFTTQQLEMIEAIRNAIRYGGAQAIAASRGEGKTKLFERTLLKYTLAA